jgi:hypothetical protein
MTNYLIGPVFTLACAGLMLGYWIWRFNREHKERMVEIDARAAAHEAEFDAKRRAWDVANAKAKAEDDTRLAALRAEFPELESMPEPPAVASPGG